MNIFDRKFSLFEIISLLGSIYLFIGVILYFIPTFLFSL